MDHERGTAEVDAEENARSDPVLPEVGLFIVYLDTDRLLLVTGEFLLNASPRGQRAGGRSSSLREGIPGDVGCPPAGVRWGD
jgi:hypothetical protein